MILRTLFCLLLCALAIPSQATWSIVVYDTITQEAGVASATCISNSQIPGIDLRELLPVVVVGQGAGAAQSAQDGSGERRMIMDSGIRMGLDSQMIIDDLVVLPNNAINQHGVTSGASSATQTGGSNFPHASGVAGNDGDLYYAIQGNVLTGPEVVTMTEQTLLNTGGDLPDRLMAAMETARDFGGDGRCSCPGGPNANSCGSPPPMFDKSAHVGFLTLSRFGDTDDPVCNSNGCADGDYYLNINIADQPPAADDPVNQMRAQFDSFRAGLLGRPDAVQSVVSFIPVMEGYLLTLELRDHTGQPLLSSVDGVTIEHAPDSAVNTSIGPVQDNGDGSYTSLLTVMGADGDDVFLITIQDQARTLVVPPALATLRLESFFIDGFEQN